MKLKIILVFLLVSILWGINNRYLNEVSKKEKFLQDKERELKALEKRYDNKIIEYDKAIDLQKIEKEQEEKGLKRTRYVEHFKIDSKNKE